MIILSSCRLSHFFLSARSLHGINNFLSQLLSPNTLDNVLLSRTPVAHRYQYTGRNVAGDTTDKYDSSQGDRPNVVIDSPCTSSQRDLQAAVHIEQDGNRDQEINGKRKVRKRFVRFVVSVGFRELFLVMLELALLFWREYRRLGTGIFWFKLDIFCANTVASREVIPIL